jgi:mannosyltransferase OCH1-like enzyme
MRPLSSRILPPKLQLDMTSGVKMNSPISSPFQGRLTSQVRRVLPAYIVLIVLVIFFINADFFTAPIRAHQRHRREARYRTLPETKGTVIPPKIWQTWKTGPLSFAERDLAVARTWPEKNPGHRYEVLTDNNDIAYVEWHYGPHGFNRPDIVELYRSIGITIVKADLLRYLIMYAEGGVYADIDVECIRPIERFIPERFDLEEVDMVIGIEVDEPNFENHPILGSKCKSFCQWTFAAKPRLPVLMRLIETIQDWLHDLSLTKGVPISQLQLDFDEVISGTGPSAFTEAVLAQMSMNVDMPVTWNLFRDLAESKLVGGILVLPVEAFAAGQGHSDSGNHGSRGALIKHHYHASGWPNKHHRYSHPMYGPVEWCNWEPLCVAGWDDNVAEWEKLSQEEQAHRLALKTLAEQEEKEQLAQQQQREQQQLAQQLPPQQPPPQQPQLQALQ